MNIYDEIKDYAEQLQDRVDQLNGLINNGPDGNLVIHHRQSGDYYAIRWTEDGERKNRYIGKEKDALIERYAKKFFAKSLLPALKDNYRAASLFIKNHSRVEEDDIIKNISPQILELCSDLYLPKDQLIKEWLESKGPESPIIGAPPSVETNDGGRVRSKSEAIIANALHSHNLIYQYERPLYLNTKRFAIFPDFTLYDPKTELEKYWEHFGMMGDPDYARQAVEKISEYAKNGIIIGKNLICTFEDDIHPLSSSVVEGIIGSLL